MPWFKQEILDAIVGAAFLARHLEIVAKRVFERKHPEFLARKVFAIAQDMDPGATLYTYEIGEEAGRAKIVSDYATDIPVIGIATGAISQKLHELAAMFQYPIGDLEKIRMSGRDTNQRKMVATRRAHLSLHEDLVWQGDTAKGIWGLVSHPFIPRMVAANSFDASSTGDQILAVMNLAWEQMRTNTNNVETPNTLLMSSGPYSYVASTPRSSASDKTILSYFLEAHPEIDLHMPVPRLDAQGTAGGDMMFLLDRNAENMGQLSSLQPSLLPPQPEALLIKVFMRSRHGGFVAYYPFAAFGVEAI